MHHSRHAAEVSRPIPDLRGLHWLARLEDALVVRNTCDAQECNHAWDLFVAGHGDGTIEAAKLPLQFATGRRFDALELSCERLAEAAIRSFFVHARLTAEHLTLKARQGALVVAAEAIRELFVAGENGAAASCKRHEMFGLRRSREGRRLLALDDLSLIVGRGRSCVCLSAHDDGHGRHDWCVPNPDWSVGRNRIWVL